MAEQMSIVDAQGNEVGSVVVHSVEHQHQLEQSLARDGFHLEEPAPPPPPDLERGGDLEAGECKEDLAEGEVDNCAISASVSYTWDFAKRHGVNVPQLDRIIDAKVIPSKAEALAAVAEAVEALRWAPLSPKEAHEIREYVKYGFPGLEENLPAEVAAG